MPRHASLLIVVVDLKTRAAAHLFHPNPMADPEPDFGLPQLEIAGSDWPGRSDIRLSESGELGEDLVGHPSASGSNATTC